MQRLRCEGWQEEADIFRPDERIFDSVFAEVTAKTSDAIDKGFSADICVLRILASTGCEVLTAAEAYFEEDMAGGVVE